MGTPTFFANGHKAQGAITFEEFKALLAPPT
jgi:protein-disulfide isomerase